VLRFAVLFALGTLLFHRLPELPGGVWWVAEGLLGLLLWRLPLLRPWLAALLGFAWSHAYALATLPPFIPDDAGVMRLTVDARVVSLVERSPYGVRFLVDAERIRGEAGPLPGHQRIRLSWRNPPVVMTGETWRLPVRLRAAHGYASPGAWDYEGWLYWQGVRYTGYVDPDREARRLPASPCCWLNRWRAAVADGIEGLQLSSFARGVIRALVVGDGSSLSPAARDLFRATGTSHLMVISGLHIGLLAGLGLVGVAWGWRRVPVLCAWLPASVAGAVAGLCAAALYAALAGLSLPTQRAVIMLLLFALGLIMRRETDSTHALALAAVGVLLWHPPSIVSAGFWLSFGAVLAILAALRLAPRAPRWRLAIRVQVAVSLALWPILGGFGLPSSVLAPLVNLLLVPLFGFLIVPLSLLGVGLHMVLPMAGEALLVPLGGLLDLLQQGLLSVTRLPWPHWPRAGAAADVYPAVAVGVTMLLAVPGFPMRWLAPLLLCLPWLPRAPDLEPGAFEAHILDVGQGLSVVVATRGHLLVFDTGPEFATGFSTAKAVVQPFLVQRGRHVIDRLVLSHGDKDHAGGVEHLRKALEVDELLSGEPLRIGAEARPCLAGERWDWDGVVFEFLHPAPGARFKGNNASCVLRVSNAAGSLLLTGDIEARVERRLIEDAAGHLRSDVVVAPHHGSRSSSSAGFVAATRPSHVVYTAGWANRYGFPAAAVDRRWRQAGAQVLNTARLGSIRFAFTAAGRIEGPVAHRHAAKRFWWHGGGSAEPPHAVSSIDRPGPG